MHPKREHARLQLDDRLTGRLALAAAAAKTMNAELQLAQATWEPHDWSAL